MFNLAELIDHAEQGAGKLRDIAEVHLPPLIDFLRTLQGNPLVTSMEASVGGPLSTDAMAILNGLSAMTGAVRQQVPAPGTPVVPPMPPVPGPLVPPANPAGFAVDGNGTVTPAEGMGE